jgi:aspartyl-tRNA(Asn)/glutamyl-tRNA(Gln) amidotransferase subunit C
MAIKREDVLRIASLAKLELSEEHIERYADQLSRILDYIEVLKTLPEQAEGAAAPLEGTPLRPDAVTNPADSRFGLHQAPDREGDLFRVPRIIE